MPEAESSCVDNILFNFSARTSSNITIDSLDDYARFSDDGNRETEEKIAGLSEKKKSHKFYYYY